VNDLVFLGTIYRSHGLKGFFKINVHTAGIPALEKDEPVFIQLQGGPVPFFVEECSQASHDILLMKIEDVDTIEEADKLVGTEIFIESKKFDGIETDANEGLVGYAVTDHEKGVIGKVAGVMETAQHPILEVEFEEKVILIPWVKEIVKEIDDKAKTIQVETPDGLIDLYVNA
jgi:16S rRNA processing protein RimM